MRIILLAVVLMMAGCATGPEGNALPGSALWRYEKTQEGCNISVTSGAQTIGELSGGTVEITDCNVTFNLQSVTGQDPAEVISGFVELLGLIRGGDITRALQVLQ